MRFCAKRAVGAVNEHGKAPHRRSNAASRWKSTASEWRRKRAERENDAEVHKDRRNRLAGVSARLRAVG